VTDNYNCVLCAGHVHEDRDHLFFNCNFSVRVWNYLQISWGQYGNMVQTAEMARRSFRHSFFTEVVIIACWHIWKVRNACIFDHVRPRFATWRAQFIHDISLHAHRFKKDHKEALLKWVSSLV
jgi:hypothetical protein